MDTWQEIASLQRLMKEQTNELLSQVARNEQKESMLKQLDTLQKLLDTIKLHVERL